MSFADLNSLQRSQLMARIRGKDTQPELRVRRALFALGYRYRLHEKALPGKPDLVFTRRRKIVFVHGCFWHQHGRCDIGNQPGTRLSYWIPKLTATKLRDRRHRRVLQASGWDVLFVWECQTKDADRLKRRLIKFLEAPNTRIVRTQKAASGNHSKRLLRRAKRRPLAKRQS